MEFALNGLFFNKNTGGFRFRLFGKGGFMSTLSQVEKMSQKYSASAEEFIRSGVITNLKEKNDYFR